MMVRVKKVKELKSNVRFVKQLTDEEKTVEEGKKVLAGKEHFSEGESSGGFQASSNGVRGSTLESRSVGGQQGRVVDNSVGASGRSKVVEGSSESSGGGIYGARNSGEGQREKKYLSSQQSGNTLQVRTGASTGWIAPEKTFLERGGIQQQSSNSFREDEAKKYYSIEEQGSIQSNKRRKELY